MERNELIIEQGTVAGNAYNKYETRNPVARLLMRGFNDALFSMVGRTGAQAIHEAGCGEGYVSIALAKQGKTVSASDFSERIIHQARANAQKNKVDIVFKVASIYDLTPENDAAALIVCCEVLEHLPRPEAALDILAQLANPYLIVSVPREPLWRTLNIMRGKYIKQWGNTPGHIQHWSKKSFLQLLSSSPFEIIQIVSPVPWTMVLCRSTMSRPK